MLLLIIYIYITLQLSYTLVSHNFGLVILNYGYISLYLLLNLLLNLTVLLFIQVYTFNYILPYIILFGYIRSIKPKLLNIKYIFLLVINIILMYIFIISFNPIINNVFWTSLNIEIFNTFFTWLNPYILILILPYILLWFINTIWLVTLIYISTFLIKWLYLFIYIYRNFIINILHTLILTFFIISIYLNYSSFTTWNYSNSNTICYKFNYYRNFFTNLVVIDGLYTLNNLYIYFGQTFIDIINSFLWIKPNLTIQLFHLNLDSIFTNQTISDHTYNYIFQLSIKDLSIIIIDSIYILLFPLLLILLISTKLLIIF